MPDRLPAEDRHDAHGAAGGSRHTEGTTQGAGAVLCVGTDPSHRAPQNPAEHVSLGASVRPPWPVLLPLRPLDSKQLVLGYLKMNVT